MALKISKIAIFPSLNKLNSNSNFSIHLPSNNPPQSNLLPNVSNSTLFSTSAFPIRTINKNHSFVWSQIFPVITESLGLSCRAKRYNENYTQQLPLETTHRLFACSASTTNKSDCWIIRPYVKYSEPSELHISKIKLLDLRNQASLQRTRHSCRHQLSIDKPNLHRNHHQLFCLIHWTISCQLYEDLPLKLTKTIFKSHHSDQMSTSDFLVLYFWFWIKRAV